MNLRRGAGRGGGGAGLSPAATNASAMVRDDTASATELGGSRAPAGQHAATCRNRSHDPERARDLPQASYTRRCPLPGVRSHRRQTRREDAAHALKGSAQASELRMRLETGGGLGPSFLPSSLREWLGFRVA